MSQCDPKERFDLLKPVAYFLVYSLYKLHFSVTKIRTEKVSKVSHLLDNFILSVVIQ